MAMRWALARVAAVALLCLLAAALLLSLAPWASVEEAPAPAEPALAELRLEARAAAGRALASPAARAAAEEACGALQQRARVRVLATRRPRPTADPSSC